MSVAEQSRAPRVQRPGFTGTPANGSNAPLTIATGAGAVSRRAVGTPVVGGMLTASVAGIFVIPMLFVVFQSLRERAGQHSARRPTAQAATSD